MSETQGVKRSATVHFHALAAGGEAVGRDEGGKTVFAAFAAPGDVARVDINSEKSFFARGTLTALETPSPQRTVPFCPQFRPQAPQSSCGGCTWQHVSTEAQREAKREIVQNALTRIGGQNIVVEPCRGGSPSHYRNKADFVIGHGKSGAEIGFFATGSHDLVPAAVCPIQRPQNEEILQAAREILRAHPQWAFDAASGRGFWRRLVARVDSSGSTLATLVLSRDSNGESSRLAQELRQSVPHLVGVLERYPKSEARLLWGRDFLVETMHSLDFRVAGDAFWQVNPEVSPMLVEEALDMAQARPGQTVVDLFCGAGLFTLHLAKQATFVTGIEVHEGAIRDAIFNAKENVLLDNGPGAERRMGAIFHAGDANRELRRFRPGSVDLVLLDPPRAGAAECMETLARLAPPRIVYVSCDPATLARDAKFLCANGYVLTSAVPFDMFPQTAHVETAALFLKR